jgi:hypothetical protein
LELVEVRIVLIHFFHTFRIWGTDRSSVVWLLKPRKATLLEVSNPFHLTWSRFRHSRLDPPESELTKMILYCESLADESLGLPEAGTNGAKE